MASDDIRMIGRYEVEREIGRGGMAVVYKAFDPLLNRIVAIKLIKMDVFGASVLGSIRERFNREAKALAKLNHSNIVKILDYGEQDGAPFLVMDFIEGVTIKEITKPIRYGAGRVGAAPRPRGRGHGRRGSELEGRRRRAAARYDALEERDWLTS